jgi:hypothetical protein
MSNFPDGFGSQLWERFDSRSPIDESFDDEDEDEQG